MKNLAQMYKYIPLFRKDATFMVDNTIFFIWAKLYLFLVTKQTVWRSAKVFQLVFQLFWLISSQSLPLLADRNLYLIHKIGAIPHIKEIFINWYLLIGYKSVSFSWTHTFLLHAAGWYLAMSYKGYLHQQICCKKFHILSWQVNDWHNFVLVSLSWTFLTYLISTFCTLT